MYVCWFKTPVNTTAVMKPCKPWPGHCRGANRTRFFWNWPRNDSAESLHHVFAVPRCWQDSESALFDRCAHSIRKMPSLESRATVMITFKMSSNATWANCQLSTDITCFSSEICFKRSCNGRPNPGSKQQAGLSMKAAKTKKPPVADFSVGVCEAVVEAANHFWKVQCSFESLSLSHSNHAYCSYVCQLSYPEPVPHQGWLGAIWPLTLLECLRLKKLFGA